MKYLKRFWQISSAPLICAVLGFAGAVCIVPFSGVMTALPLLTVCALLAGFVDMHPAAKATIFAVCGGLLGAGYSGEAFDIIVFAAICGISGFLGHVTVNLFRDETKRFWAVLPLAGWLQYSSSSAETLFHTLRRCGFLKIMLTNTTTVPTRTSASSNTTIYPAVGAEKSLPCPALKQSEDW